MSKHNRLVPYLTVAGANEAIKFYEEAFDAEEINVRMAEDGKRVIHAELEINDCPLMLSDNFPEMGASDTAAPGTAGGTSVVIHLDFKKPKHVDQVIEQAVRAGATLTLPAHDTFWGARYGRVRDPFGHVWALHAFLKKKDREKHEDNAALSSQS
jgi:PhnB protein